MTDYHAKYWAHALSLKNASNSIRNLSRSISNAKVDLNPHQVHAALFALQSPLSKGAILADEVGLGKTIEAGLVIAQRWAEKKRKILLITPAFLRKQWECELQEKFGLPTRILDAKNAHITDVEEIVICSYQFAASRGDLIGQAWDLVVIDEAHRLRNVYKPSNKYARAIAESLKDSFKILLTATPLQNNLMELYGLISVIDPFVFGDEVSFREQFVLSKNIDERNKLLKQRIEPLIVRTLRKQVQEYVPFTRRIAITQNFVPNDDEQELYESVSAYLQRKDLAALPNGQRQLITLVLRKLLASSSFAITHTLRSMIERLEKESLPQSLLEELDEEQIASLDEELKEKLLLTLPDEETLQRKEKIKLEVIELRSYLDLAEKILFNAKGEALLIALEKAFGKAEELGAARKAVIFTESTRTQAYLYELLSSNGFKDQIVKVNGSNKDADSTAIYNAWVKEQVTPPAHSTKAVNIKAALVQHFRSHASILLATEAAAEGVNLQFASLVVNYDLPWNPQRIEQRIGRCHRYGQKHDVVVVNFVNTRNEADKRVFELLNEKFHLFDGVFGASDDVLGAIESGVDIEMRIHDVYQTCRTPAEIQQAFDVLREELDSQIQLKMTSTQESILDHFDEEVSALLKTYKEDAEEALNERERWLFQLACHELGQPMLGHPFFIHNETHYCMNWRLAEEKNGVFFRETDPLATSLISKAKTLPLSPSNITFSYSNYPQKISLLEPLVGKSGWIELSELTIDTFEKVETLIFTGFTDDNFPIDQKTCEKLFQLQGLVDRRLPEELPSFDQPRKNLIDNHIETAEASAARIFEDEVDKLESWSEDLKNKLEYELKDLEKEIKDARKASTKAKTFGDKLESQKKIKQLEAKRSAKRHALFDEQDRIDSNRDTLISNHEKRLTSSFKVNPLFTIRWSVI